MQSRCDVFSAFVHVLTGVFSFFVFVSGVRDSFCPTLPVLPDLPTRSSNLAMDLLGSANEVVKDNTKDDEVPVLDPAEERKQRRRRNSFAKKKRMSLWASTIQPGGVLVGKQKNLFRERKTPCRLDESLPVSLADPVAAFQNDEISSVVCEIGADELDFPDVVKNEEALPLVFAFLTEHELSCNASLVCTAWAEAATIATVNLMLTSVGYHDEDNESDVDPDALVEATSSATSLERPWSYLNSRFPWGCFLSEGAFKRVFKVHNSLMDQEEAVSVM